MVDQELSIKTLVSTDKIGTLSFDIKEAGVYIVELSSRDKLGRLQKVFADLYVSGKEPVTWEQPEDLVFSTTWDKKNLSSWAKSQIVAPKPLSKGQGLDCG